MKIDTVTNNVFGQKTVHRIYVSSKLRILLNPQKLMPLNVKRQCPFQCMKFILIQNFTALPIKYHCCSTLIWWSPNRNTIEVPSSPARLMRRRRSSLHSEIVQFLVISIWKSSKSDIKAANRDALCLPLPPIPSQA